MAGVGQPPVLAGGHSALESPRPDTYARHGPVPIACKSAATLWITISWDCVGSFMKGPKSRRSPVSKCVAPQASAAANIGRSLSRRGSGQVAPLGEGTTRTRASSASKASSRSEKTRALIPPSPPDEQQKKGPGWGPLFWRRGRDSNPRCLFIFQWLTNAPCPVRVRRS